MRKLLLSLFLFSFPLLHAQDSSFIRVAFYNVENLFDTEKDSCKHDDEFLPNSIRAWHYGRYKKKLADISKVITAIGEWSPPTLVGLCEVENNRVLHDLIRYSALKEQDYRYVMTNSPDGRGIDVALLYQRDQFKLLGFQSIPVTLSNDNRPTRDILHVTGLIITADTLDVFVVHFPSRSGGEKATEPNRLQAAETLRSAVDSLFALRIEPRIIIMGDFNDYPDNKSISQVLNAKSPEKPIQQDKLYHLLARKAKKRDYGSYKYQGEWNLLDHLIVSGELLNETSSVHTNEETACVLQLPFLLKPDEKYGGMQPFRTYYGMKYEGGFSDHLPVYFDLLLKE